MKASAARKLIGKKVRWQTFGSKGQGVVKFVRGKSVFVGDQFLWAPDVKRMEEIEN